jgi:2-desacetyl-2-hydroxyethyl bacteriochlorophyllide A dehydrogenase
LRAVAFQGPGEVAVRELPEPVPAPGEALVAPRFVGLCGTDLELLEGTMPYFSQGHARFPLQPGHEVSGVVVRSPQGAAAPGTRALLHPIVGCGSCERCAQGRPEHCAEHKALGVRDGMPGGAAELVAVPAANLFPLPEGLSLRDAVLAEPGVTALNGVLAVEPEPGMRALVVGAGTLGLIAAQLLRDRGLEVDVLLVDPRRAALVEELGVRAIERAEADSYEAVVEYAGSAAAVATAIAAVAPGGSVALAGVQPGEVDSVDVNAIVLKGITVRGISGPERFSEMLAELAAGAVAAAPLIDREYELEDAAAAYARLGDAERPRPKVLLRIGAGGD